MELQATLHGIAARDVRARASDLIERVGLAQAQDRRVGTYSGGMRRRLDLAMALIHAPEVLFLDEPTTGLDPVSRVTLWDEVRRLKDEGTTVFLTTQYLEEADQLADRVGIISAGKIVAEGTPDRAEGRGRQLPHLDITLAADGPGRPRAAPTRSSGASATCGPPARAATSRSCVERGAADIAQVVRALDEAGFLVESLELVEPTLDDVFIAKTGRPPRGRRRGASRWRSPA